MNRVSAVVSAALCLTLAGCAQGGDDHRARKTASLEPVQAECVEVADKAGALAVMAGNLATGDATANQVRAAGGDLVDAFARVVQAAGPDLDRANLALRRVQDALTTQPIDTEALRAATDQVLTTATRTCPQP